MEKYNKVADEVHCNARFKEGGLFVFPGNVFLAATLHVLVQCDCCGAGVVEVKCPRNAGDGPLTNVLANQNSCVFGNEG